MPLRVPVRAAADLPHRVCTPQGHAFVLIQGKFVSIQGKFVSIQGEFVSIQGEFVSIQSEFVSDCRNSCRSLVSEAG